MRTLTDSSLRHEFYFPDLDNLILVENCPNGVVIHATRDNFSEPRKAFFIRELAAEGFIPDSCIWFSSSSADAYLGVRWVIDRSWVGLHRKVTNRTNRLMRRLLLGAGLFWVGLMSLLFLCHR